MGHRELINRPNFLRICLLNESNEKIISVKTNVGEIKVKTDISANVKLNENVQIKPSNDNIIIFDGATDKSLNSEFMQ